MMTKERLKDIFGKFVGLKADMVQGDTEIAIGDTTIKVANDVLSPRTNKLFDDVREAASENGLTARIIWPDTMVTMDFIETRIDLYLLKDQSGRLLLSLDSQNLPPRAPDHAEVTRKGLNTPLKPLKPPRFKPPTA